MGSIGSVLGGVAGSAIGGPIGGSIGSSLGGMLGGKIAGGGSSGGGGFGGVAGSTAQAPILGFEGGGVLAKLNPEKARFNIKSSDARKSLIDQLKTNLMQSGAATREAIPGFQGAFGEAIGGTRGLLEQVAPGSSRLREARLTALENAKARSKSNLTENLARRRVGGSSFANQLAAEQDLAFAEERDAIEAESFLQEMELTNQLQQQLLGQEIGNIDTTLKNTLSALQFEGAATQTELDEQNFLAGIAAKMASGATAAATSFAQTQNQLAADASAMAGSSGAFGSGLGGGGLGGLGDMLGGAFGGFGAASGQTGGLDPTTGITWNSGRVGVNSPGSISMFGGF